MSRVLFLADPQLGCYASFSGLTEADVARLAELGMKARVAPPVEGFEWDARRYALAIGAANRLRPDLVIVGGDMVDDASSDAQRGEFLRITRKLDPGIPMRWAPGNHDVTGDGATPTTASLARYRQHFGADFYAFDLATSGGPARFVVMNTAVACDPREVPDEWNAQLSFIERSLSEASAASIPTVLVGHHPLFVKHPDEPDTYWNIPRAQRASLLETAHRYGVRLALAGHLHRNAQAMDGELAVVVSGPVGYPLGDDPSGFRVLDLGPEGWTHAYEHLPEVG